MLLRSGIQLGQGGEKWIVGAVGGEDYDSGGFVMSERCWEELFSRPKVDDSGEVTRPTFS